MATCFDPKSYDYRPGSITLTDDTEVKERIMESLPKIYPPKEVSLIRTPFPSFVISRNEFGPNLS